MHNKKQIIKKIIASTSAIVFLIACFNPAFEVTHITIPSDVAQGYACFIFGGFGIYCFYLWNFVWLANPLYILSLVSFAGIEDDKYVNKSIILSLCSVIIGISFYYCDSICINESGSPSGVGSLYLGYYLWVLSFIIQLVGVSLYKIIKSICWGR